MKALAEAALRVLARAGERTEGENGESVWRFKHALPTGTKFEISLRGPELPATVPMFTAAPSEIPKDPKWRGDYRLMVAPPLVALDLAWQLEAPLRIFVFSRGDWEEFLLNLAAG